MIDATKYSRRAMAVRIDMPASRSEPNCPFITREHNCTSSGTPPATTATSKGMLERKTKWSAMETAAKIAIEESAFKRRATQARLRAAFRSPAQLTSNSTSLPLTASVNISREVREPARQRTLLSEPIVPDRGLQIGHPLLRLSSTGRRWFQAVVWTAENTYWL